jgi:hypothetical protein
MLNAQRQEKQIKCKEMLNKHEKARKTRTTTNKQEQAGTNTENETHEKA